MTNSNTDSLQKIFDRIKEQINDEEVLKWIKDLKIVSIVSNTIKFEAPNKYIKMWVEDHYLDYLVNLLKKAFHSNADIIITSKTNASSENSQSHQSANMVKQEKENNNTDRYSIPLDKQNTFETFVVGRSNRFAHAACVSAAKGFEMLNNPIYIHGNVGLGKTHLMHAVGNYVRFNFPAKRVLFTTGENFVREFLSSMQHNRTEDFREKYAVDVLLFDDVQYIAGKDATSKEFFSIFNQLHDHKKQIILTSNSLPDDIADLDKRLISRFKGGLIVEIGAPSVEEKIAIVESHLKNNNYSISSDVIRFIAENIKSESTRDLLGVIHTIIVKGQLLNIEITIDYIQNEFKDFFLQRNRVLTPDDIIKIVSEYYNIKLVDMQAKSRARDMVIPRNIAIYLIYHNTHSSLASVGAIFNRDHSTIKNSLNQIEMKMKNNDEYTVNTIEQLNKKMKII